MGVRLTQAAYAHGLALALPHKVVMARPTGVGRAIATYEIPIEGRDEWLAAAQAAGVSDHRLRGELPQQATQRQMDVLAAYVAGGSVADAAELVGIRPSTVKRHLADLRARSGLTTEQLIYAGRASGRLSVPSLEPH